MIVQKQQDILATPKSAYITKIEILDRLSATDSIQSIYRNGIELVNFGNYNIDRLYIDTTCEPATEYTYSLYVNGSEVCSTTVTTPDTAQKYANQVQLGNKTLMDITDSTVTPETLLEGEMAYNAAGEFIIGTATFQSPNRILYYEDSPYVNVPAGTYVSGYYAPKPLLASGFTIVDDDGNNIPYETDGGTMLQQVRFVMPLTNCRFVALS